MSTPVSIADLAPTLLGFAGVPPAGPVDCRDLGSPLREGSEPDLRPVFADLAPDAVHNDKIEYTAGVDGHVMVRREDWK